MTSPPHAASATDAHGEADNQDGRPLGSRPSTKLRRVATVILLWGAIAAVLSALPALVLSLLPPEYSVGLFASFAVMLTLVVTPIAVLIASAGAVLLFVSLLRRALGS